MCVTYGHVTQRLTNRGVSLQRSLRLFRIRMSGACVYFGFGRTGHASIPESDDSSMRLFRGRLAQPCVNSGIGQPEHASIPEPVDRACVYFGVG